jgi:AcrR family transcriptional regulator
MPRTSNKRERLIRAASELIHQQGYAKTTLADISSASEVPLGNVYYYFKTKDDIVRAVIDERIKGFQQAIAEWNKLPDPRQRLNAMLDMAYDYRNTLAKYGCPVGSLCQELNKDAPVLAEKIDFILGLQLTWVRAQLEKLGHEDAAGLAEEMISGLQGASLLANSTKDPELMGRQVERLRTWLNSL